MKVLSVRQPYAWALIHGGKDVENRNWPTNFRGRLAIHAGLKFDFTKAEWLQCTQGAYGEPWQSMARAYNQLPGHTLGAIIGTVDVYGCVPDNECHSPWKAHGEGFFCWLVRNPVALEVPILVKGRLGPSDVVVAQEVKEFFGIGRNASVFDSISDMFDDIPDAPFGYEIVDGQKWKRYREGYIGLDLVGLLRNHSHRNDLTAVTGLQTTLAASGRMEA